jgi:hypothetical protein
VRAASAPRFVLLRHLAFAVLSRRIELRLLEATMRTISLVEKLFFLACCAAACHACASSTDGAAKTPDAGAMPMDDGGSDVTDAGPHSVTDVGPPSAEPCGAPGEHRECYGGAPHQAGVGACDMGVQECISDHEFGGSWGPCLGWIGPADEACGDGRDDDCDGNVDEGCRAPDADAGTSPPPDGCEVPPELMLAPCPRTDQVRAEDGTCAVAPRECPDRSACVMTAASNLPAGHFLRTFMWDLSDCAGHDCCLDCVRSSRTGDAVPGAWRCRSGVAHCIETVERGECILSSGYCVCD